MNVSQFFRFLFVRKQINDGKEFVNRLTNELVFRDEQFDTEHEWEMRGVHNVCCLTKYPYDSSNDEDVDIDFIAKRIATEEGWR